tara:strand:+ start:1069 stop:3096 length:2028 start_codon:yes stop_codon:yes gene_type:complete
MCGIFGIIATSNELKKNKKKITEIIRFLGIRSQSRGKDSSGLCYYDQSNDEINIFKGPIASKYLFNNKNLKSGLDIGLSKPERTSYVFGHSRLVTNGTQLDDNNNQPLIVDKIIGVHNGIVVNVDELWNKNTRLKRKNDIDSEVIFALIKNRIINDSLTLESAVSKTMNEITGTAAIAFVDITKNKFVLATNNGSLYTIKKNDESIIFASERVILNQLKHKLNLKYSDVNPLHSGYGISISLDDLVISSFSFNDKLLLSSNKDPKPVVRINSKNINSHKKQLSVVKDLNSIHISDVSNYEKKLLEYPIDIIKKLKRCTRCILPETFPFIYYDLNGVCNYCNNHVLTTKPKSKEKLLRLVQPYRKLDGSHDVLLPLSGGRDSCYLVHFVKNELELNPITFTYDWGMVTDLARRNIARVCGKLGIENIIVAADIHWKRKNINKNIVAWLKNPSLGMIPLFMAGDKYFFYYAHKIKKQLGIDLEIWGVNQLENTDFKVGFSGISPNHNKEHIYSLSFLRKLRLMLFVAKNIFINPNYINQSLLDTIGSIYSRYYTPKNHYYHLFDYIKWDEDLVNNIIIEEYEWEKSVDTISTWRIGDGTASFYNYIYTLVAGFSEHDTFRSNQIRDGLIERNFALKMVYQENIPRYNSIKWYLEITGLDFKQVIKKINKMKRLTDGL